MIGLFVVGALAGYGNLTYWIADVEGYLPIRKVNRSSLFQVDAPLVNDSRPVWLLELVGSSYQVGFDYTSLIGPQIQEEYLTFMRAEVPKTWQLFLLQFFLDWQFQRYYSRAIPRQFRQQLRGISDGANSINKGFLLQYIRRVLVISSYPGNIGQNIWFSLVNQFKKHLLESKRDFSFQMFDFNQFAQFSYDFAVEKGISCSFFAVWGSRTESGKLFTMRNLDWQSNIGLNKHKLITVYKIDNKIPHVTVGFAGVIGALTGMSAQGITVHEAGLDSQLEQVMGFQWTLRLRYVMMNAKNLEEAIKIWNQTSNTFGMNHMIASSKDVSSGHPAVVLQTNGKMTAFFRDEDPRQNLTQFTDPKTKKNYTAGWSMKEAVFRTNHAYDPKIRGKMNNKGQLSQKDDSMIRYLLLKQGFIFFRNNFTLIGEEEALYLTALMGDKGSLEFKSCPSKHIGINVISAMYEPSKLRMLVAFQYGQDSTFITASCGAYLRIDMSVWLTR